MRLTSPLLTAALLAACGSDPVTPTTATETGGGSSSSGSSEPTVTDPTSSTSTTEDSPTEASGTVGMTDGGTTTGTSQVSDTGTADTGTTNPAQTDTTPVETSTTDGETIGETESTGTTDAPETGTTDGTTDGTTGAVEEACECPVLEVALDDGIFVLSQTAELWKFFPENNSFQQLGPIGCDLFPNTFSMAVDRLGYAWVQYQGGELRKVAVTNVDDCTDPGYQLGQTDDTNFGMAFVSNSSSDACDRIYGNTASGFSEGNAIADFFAIDPVTLKVLPIAKTDYGTAELTGTGDGRAFFFAGANPAKLIEVNKATGAKLGVIPLPGVELGSAWAFAFFGGDFYFFTNSQGGAGSEVTHIDYDDSDKNGVQDIKVIIPNAPISIVGAGVSTCAPISPQ